MTYIGHMTGPMEMLLAGWAATSLLMAAFWRWHLRVGNAGLVDVGWTLSMVALAGLYASVGPGDAVRRLVMVAMVAIWGGRLATYLLRDRVLGRPEDQRYSALRRSSVAAAGNFFAFFQAQALLAVVLSAPLLVASLDRRPMNSALELVAVGLWAVALAGETIADRQLERFKQRAGTSGRVCRDGLWRYSRHPNYFFEWLVWVAFALYAARSPWTAVGFIAPVLMLFFLFRITGIPATASAGSSRHGWPSSATAGSKPSPNARRRCSRSCAGGRSRSARTAPTRSTTRFHRASSSACSART